MSDSITSPQFEAKVTELVQATRGLPVPHLLQLRRLTMADPETLRWANERQLTAVFHLILSQAIESMPLEELDAASMRHFDPLLPPGDEETRDKDRWLLFDLARRRLLQPAKPAAVQSTDPDDIAPALPDFEPVVADTFPKLFDETVARYTSRALSVLATPAERAHTPKPFYLHPGFAASYEEVLRRFLLPDIRATKRIRAMAEGRKWDKDGFGRLIAMIQSGDDSNPILESWDSRWKACHAQGLGNKDHSGVWETFRAGAEQGGWHAPTEDDIPLLRLVLRWEAELLSEGWHEMAQVYQQEFAPKSKHDQARPGAFRDSVVKWVRAIPHYGGDALAIKAFLVLPKCDRMFLRSLVQSLGSSQTQRKRLAPLLVSYFESLPP